MLVLKPLFEGGRRWFDSSSRNLVEGGRGKAKAERPDFFAFPLLPSKRLACFNGEAAGF